jgi:hypothetical protein
VVLYVSEEWGILWECFDHLLLYCDVARVVWSSFYSLFRVEWVIPRRVMDLLSGWGTSLGHGHVMRLWKQVPLCVMWSLWHERNARLLEDVELLVVDLCQNVLNMLYVWVSTHSPSHVIFAEFLHSYYFVSSNYGHFCILHVYYSCAPLHFLLKAYYLSKKKMSKFMLS